VQGRRNAGKRSCAPVEKPCANDVVGPALEHGTRRVQTENSTRTGFSHGGGCVSGLVRARIRRA
jgi:hypothetical protein